MSALAVRNATGDTSEFSRPVRARLGGDGIVVTNTNDVGAGSLRAALAAANANADPSTILFNIPGTAPHVISPAAFLGVNTGPVIIDLPQAISAAANNQACKMLLRDVENLATYFGRFAPELLTTNFGMEIWSLYQSSQLRHSNWCGGSKFLAP